MLLTILTAGVEAAADNVVRDEIEYVCFARVNAEQVESIQTAALTGGSEKQEQYQVKAPNGLVRVRRTNDTEIALTAKAWIGETRKEINCECTAELLDTFALAAGSGWLKQRFKLKLADTAGMWATDHPNYEVTGDGSLFWELDFFTKDGTVFSPWIKIDLEVPSHDVPLPELDFDVEESMCVQYKERTAEQHAFCTQLYDEEWKYIPALLRKPTAATEDCDCTTV